MDQQKFRQLRDKWYAKLKEKGFEDIENTKMNSPELKKFDRVVFKKVSASEYESRTKYYSNCSEILNTYKFKSKLEEKIWALHSEGLSLREIEKEIKGKLKKDWINQTIHTIKTNGMKK